ncbi:MAG: hypothetical protein ACTHV8_03990, partial [Nesterenkonia sp.]
TACFTGEYPIELPPEEQRDKMLLEQPVLPGMPNRRTKPSGEQPTGAPDGDPSREAQVERAETAEPTSAASDDTTTKAER